MNCLPVPLDMNISLSLPKIDGSNYMAHNNEPEQEYIHIDPQDEYQELYNGLKQILYLTLKLSGFEESKKILIHDPSNMSSMTSMQVIPLKSSNSELIISSSSEEATSLIQVYVKTGLLNSKDIYIYAKTCLINQTYNSLDFYGFDKKSNRKSKIHRGGNKTGYSIGAIHILGNQENLMVSFKDFSHETSNEIDISEAGSYALELKSSNEDNIQLYEFAVNISLQKAGI